MKADPDRPRQRVRIWFGELLVAEYIADTDKAFRYQRVMAPTFVGLRITLDPAAVGAGTASAAELPDEQLWPLTVK
jgi:hypothetical protein